MVQNCEENIITGKKNIKKISLFLFMFCLMVFAISLFLYSSYKDYVKNNPSRKEFWNNTTCDDIMLKSSSENYGKEEFVAAFKYSNNLDNILCFLRYSDVMKNIDIDEILIEYPYLFNTAIKKNPYLFNEHYKENTNISDYRLKELEASSRDFTFRNLFLFSAETSEILNKTPIDYNIKIDTRYHVSHNLKIFSKDWWRHLDLKTLEKERNTNWNSNLAYYTMDSSDDIYPIHIAAGNITDPKILKKLLEYGASINARTSGGSTPLMVASFSNNAEIVETLLDAGADLYAKTENGGDALSSALIHNTLEVVELLIKKGAKISEIDINGDNILMLVSKYTNDTRVLDLLLNEIDINKKDNKGCTALQYAVRYNNNEKIIEHLVKKGADINYVKKNKATWKAYFDVMELSALENALIYNGNTAVSEILINNAEKLDADQVLNAICRRNNLVIGSYNFDLPHIMELLINRGIYPTIKFISCLKDKGYNQSNPDFYWKMNDIAQNNNSN